MHLLKTSRIKMLSLAKWRSSNCVELHARKRGINVTVVYYHFFRYFCKEISVALFTFPTIFTAINHNQNIFNYIHNFRPFSDLISFMKKVKKTTYVHLTYFVPKLLKKLKKMIQQLQIIKINCPHTRLDYSPSCG